MCLKAVGAELAMMAGTVPKVRLHVFYDNVLVCKQAMKSNYLAATPAPLTPRMEAVLAADKRKRGERRPNRLVLGTFCRRPYFFFSTPMPEKGLLFPDGDLCAHLRLELWVDSRQPLYTYAPILHFRCSDPRIHPFGKRLHWVPQAHWTPAYTLVRPNVVRDESLCGCCVRVRISFTPFNGGCMLLTGR